MPWPESRADARQRGVFRGRCGFSCKIGELARETFFVIPAPSPAGLGPEPPSTEPRAPATAKPNRTKAPLFPSTRQPSPTSSRRSFFDRGLLFSLCKAAGFAERKLFRHLGAAGNRIFRPAAARDPRRGPPARSLLRRRRRGPVGGPWLMSMREVRLLIAEGGHSAEDSKTPEQKSS